MIAPPSSIVSDANVMEKEEPVNIRELPMGAVLEVETAAHVYQVENKGVGRALISGHPKYCPDPVLVSLSSFIKRGARMEFQHPFFGQVATSRELDSHPHVHATLR